MPHPRYWKGGQMPCSNPGEGGGELGAAGIDWCIKETSRFDTNLKQWNCKNFAITWCIVIAVNKKNIWAGFCYELSLLYANYAKTWLYTSTESICIWTVVLYRNILCIKTTGKARCKRHATAVPNSVDRIKFYFSTAIARRLKPGCATAVLHGSSSTWFQASCYRRDELNS